MLKCGRAKGLPWSAGTIITGAPNSSTRHTGPYNFDRIEFSILPEEATRIAALESGDIDYVNGISNPLDVAILEAADVTVQQAPFGQVRMIYIQNHVPPFNDALVRQALNYSVNREEITQIVTDGADQISRRSYQPGYAWL